MNCFEDGESDTMPWLFSSWSSWSWSSDKHGNIRLFEASFTRIEQGIAIIREQTMKLTKTHHPSTCSQKCAQIMARRTVQSFIKNSYIDVHDSSQRFEERFLWQICSPLIMFGRSLVLKMWRRMVRKHDRESAHRRVREGVLKSSQQTKLEHIRRPYLWGRSMDPLWSDQNGLCNGLSL